MYHAENTVVPEQMAAKAAFNEALLQRNVHMQEIDNLVEDKFEHNKAKQFINRTTDVMTPMAVDLEARRRLHEARDPSNASYREHESENRADAENQNKTN